jgi:hypothetical protein
MMAFTLEVDFFLYTLFTKYMVTAADAFNKTEMLKKLAEIVEADIRI